MNRYHAWTIIQIKRYMTDASNYGKYVKLKKKEKITLVIINKI